METSVHLTYPSFGSNTITVYICLLHLYLGSNGTKLEKCVTLIVIGFQSIDDNITSTQYIFKEGESKRNFFAGNRTELCEYILSHFCPPVIDMSCDPSGTVVTLHITVQQNIFL